MGSIRGINPVKLFMDVLGSGKHRIGQTEKRLENQLISDYGPVDHRLSLIPTDGAIHRVFLSFEHLIEPGVLAEIRNQSRSIEKEFSKKIGVGFLDNRHVVIAASESNSEASPTRENVSGEVAIEFRNGGIHFSAATPSVYRSSDCQEFFSAMRTTYRGQLRSMCLLRR